MLKQNLKQLFTPVIHHTDNRSYRRIMMTHYVLVAIFISTFIFFFLNIYREMYFIALLDFFAFFISIYAFYQLRVKHNLNQTALVTTFAFIFFFLFFIFMKGNDHFGLIWSIYAPIIAFSLNGKRLGLLFSLFFYAFTFTLAYNNIGVWSDGAWGITEFVRFFFASIILVFLLYMHDRSLEESDFKLTEIRAKEKEYIDKLQLLSITDPLTSLYNRRYFNELMPKVISIAQRNQLYITFFILDVDFFKPFNDNYGHIAGDKALVAISKAIKNHIQRDDDFVFRFGGEEFGGVLLSDDIKRAEAHARELVPLIESLGIEHKYSSVSDKLTVSIGITTVNPNVVNTIEMLYLLADKELYKAKENGRNRCYCKRILDKQERPL